MTNEVFLKLSFPCLRACGVSIYSGRFVWAPHSKAVL